MVQVVGGEGRFGWCTVGLLAGSGREKRTAY